jgi:hypothetical protein
MTDGEVSAWRERLDRQGLNVPTDVGWTIKFQVLQTIKPEQRLSLTIGGRPITVIVRRSNEEEEVDLELPGMPPQRVWYLDERWKFTGRQAFEHLPDASTSPWQ